MLAALFWKRSTKEGAIAGMIAGAIMVFLWKFVIEKLDGVFAVYELLPAFVTAPDEPHFSEQQQTLRSSRGTERYSLQFHDVDECIGKAAVNFCLCRYII